MKSEYQKYNKILSTVRGPLEKFKTCMLFNNKCEVWVIYVSNVEPTDPYEKSFINNIEMTIAILTDEFVPFQLHMGISRGMSYLASGSKQHKNISLYIHAFAAKILQIQYGNKNYVITTPLKIMRDILINNLSKDSYEEGHNNNGLIHMIEESPYYENFRFMISDKNNPNSYIFDIMQKDAGSKYWWFFFNIFPSENHKFLIIDISELNKIFDESGIE